MPASPDQTFTPKRLWMAACWLGLSMALAPQLAHAQWKWKDASGAVQYSDRPPPAGTPDSQILSRPAAARAAQRKALANIPVEAAASAASSTVDPALEARKKKLDEEKATRKKADDEKLAAQRADNCQRARGYMRSLQDGLRIARTTANGEREVLDDRARAEEAERTQGVIANNCD